MPRLNRAIRKRPGGLTVKQTAALLFGFDMFHPRPFIRTDQLTDAVRAPGLPPRSASAGCFQTAASWHTGAGTGES